MYLKFKMLELLLIASPSKAFQSLVTFIVIFHDYVSQIRGTSDIFSYKDLKQRLGDSNFQWTENFDLLIPCHKVNCNSTPFF